MEKENEDDDNRKNMRILKDLQQSEASLHWQRNGFFLVSSSILLVAVGLFHTNFIGISFGILGIMMNTIWFFIQYRSSEYIKQWKAKEQEIEKSLKSPPNLYPKKIGSYQMRKLAMLLPFPFIMIWSVVFTLSIYGIFNNVNMIPASSPLNSSSP